MSGFGRRTLLRAGLATAALATTGCRSDPRQPDPTSQPRVTPTTSSSGNPFGAPAGSTVRLVMDTDRLPQAWQQAWQRALQAAPSRLELSTTTSREVAQQVLPQLAQGTPPDLVVNSGADPVGLAEHAGRLVDLLPVVASNGSFRSGSLDHGRVAGRLVALPTTHVVWGLWYSQPLFTAHGWQPPRTLPELLALGRRARAQRLHLLDWGRDTATWLLRMALSAAVKEGGDEVRLPLENLEPGCWSAEQVQQALHGVKQLVDEKLLPPGGSREAWRDRQQAWSSDRTVLLAAGGAWLAAPGPDESFGLAVVPDPALSGHPALGLDALHAEPGDAVLVPREAGNPAGAREAVRQLVQPATARRLQQQSGLLSSQDLPVPAGDPHLQLQADLLRRAGRATFALRSIDLYGTNHDHQALWNAFLEGNLDVATLTRESQRITDWVRDDAAQVKVAIR